MTAADTRRSDLIQSLHDLADLLHDNPDLPTPWSISANDRRVVWYVHHDIADVLALAAVIDDPQVSRDGSATFPVQVTGALAGLAVTVEVHARIALDTGAQPVEPALVPALAALLRPAATLTSVTS